MWFRLIAKAHGQVAPSRRRCRSAADLTIQPQRASAMTSSQQPIYSGFSPASTAAEVVRGVDLRDRTMIVTGGYSGLGLEAVRALANAGATVIVPARDAARARHSLATMSRAVSVHPQFILERSSRNSHDTSLMRISQASGVVCASSTTSGAVALSSGYSRCTTRMRQRT